MSTTQSTEQLIASALQLSPDQRVVIVDALTSSLPLEEVDHGPTDAPEEVVAAWSDEIARRLEDIELGRVKTIPADEAERMIRNRERPSF